MQTGTRISAIGHGALIVLAIFGLPWFGPREREPIRATDVSFVSEAEFEAAQAAAPLPTEQEEPLTIALTADGQILVQNQGVERAELIPLLRAVSEERKSDKIFLRADGAIPYEGVMQVMGALNASGFRDIGLVTEQGGPRFDGQDG